MEGERLTYKVRNKMCIYLATIPNYEELIFEKFALREFTTISIGFIYYQSTGINVCVSFVDFCTPVIALVVGFYCCTDGGGGTFGGGGNDCDGFGNGVLILVIKLSGF